MKYNQGKDNPMYGKHHSEKTIQKIRTALEKKIERTCLICGKIFYTTEHVIKVGGGKMCSRKCGDIYHGQAMSGSKNPNFGKRGKRKDIRGYILQYAPDHPLHSKNGYVREHRLVMEKHIGRYLLPDEVVHHINGILSDNRIDNLKLFKNQSEHNKYHEKEKN